MRTFSELKRAASAAVSEPFDATMALCGDTATQLLSTAIKGEAALRGLSLRLYESPYGSAEHELLVANSPMRQAEAQYVVVYRSVHQLAARHARLDVEAQHQFAERELAFYDELLQDPYFAQRTLIVLNFPTVDDGVWGSFAANVPSSLPNQIRRINYGLQTRAEAHKGFLVCDIDALQAQMGRETLFDEAVYTTTEIEFSLSALAAISARIVDAVAVRSGRFHKVLIADLDNTLWGGIVSEDGIGGLQIGHALGIGRAYAAIQQWVKKLVARGVILCIVSKNDEALAKQAFSTHPDMLLTLDDVAVFVAGWDTKAEGVLRIADILHIGTEQMVFIDDSPFERGMVRTGVPGICVPELPEDPALWVDFLSAQHLFDTAAYSTTDARRVEVYREEAAREATRVQFKGEDDYLASLGMQASVEGLTPLNVSRVAQLTQRSNQFNLRTVRYTEAELQGMAAAPQDYRLLCFSLHDKFGNQGLVSVVVLHRIDDKQVFVDTWLMSCRVLRRGMEHFVANTIVEVASQAGFEQIVAEYIPTKKNAMVANLLPDIGFKPTDCSAAAIPNNEKAHSVDQRVVYTLPISTYRKWSCHIVKGD